MTSPLRTDYGANPTVTTTDLTNIATKVNGNTTDIAAGVGPVASLAKGGTGAVLAAPAGDRIFFYDQSAAATDFLALGTNLSITGTTLNATGGGGSGDPAASTHAATTKATPIDADEFPLVDSVASFALKKFTWANLKAALQSITLPWTVGSVEMGHASDTTITRMEAGLIGVEGIYVPTITGAKKIAVVTSVPGSPDANTVYIANDGGAPRVTTVTNAAAPSINVDTSDQAELLNLTNNVTGFTFTGTSRHGQKIILVLKSAAAQTITAGSSIQNGPANMITTTVAGKYHEIGLKYNLAITKWVVMAADPVGY